jgi:hypothetical protein
MPRGFVLLLLVLCLRGLDFAQDSSTGAIRGTVTDAIGARIRDSTIAAVDVETGRRYVAVSDAEGRFALELLPPGDYLARAEAAGMSAQVTPRLHVDLGGVTAIDFKLAVAATKEIVTVSDAPQWVDTQPSAVSSVIDERSIQELPLNGRRFTDLALLTPGVTQDPRGLMSGANGDLAFGGIRGFQTTYLVDGADNNNAFFAQARGRYRAPYQFSNEVVQEFRVSRNNAGAETGRAGGAVVNVVTKSGSNHIHGSAFYDGRNSGLDSRQAFLDIKPHSDQQQFGFTLGGPIQRNRIFFFGGFDQHLFHIPTVVHFDDGTSVVTPQAATGPVTPGDYETTGGPSGQGDQALVRAAAAQLTQQGGEYGSKLLGNAAFFKMDLGLSPHNNLSLRLNTSRYWGQNNVFLDPSSPLTTFGISDNGEEQVETETGVVSLTSALSFHLQSHLRAQFSRDLQQSSSNTDAPLTKVRNVIDGFGRASILPRQTRERRLHLAETVSLESGRNSWKFGGDALLTWIYNFFPSLSGGEYIFDPIKVNSFSCLYPPYNCQPQEAGSEYTPLRAYAHDLPHYYIQDFGSAVTHPNSNEYAAFAQDTVRVTDHFGLSLGARYDLQTFDTSHLVSNPLWPDSGRVPFNPFNVSPRIGLAYSGGDRRPLVVRAGYGLFYTRIPQIYNSTVESQNGLTGNYLFLNNTDAYARQIFPQYPNPLVYCAPTALSCTAPANLQQFVQSDISAFAHNFRTPEVHQASLTLEREMAEHLVIEAGYTFVRGQNLIRARDVNLPPPVNVEYPVYDGSGANLLGFYNVDSFSSWQMTVSATCPFPPCINPLARPIPQLGSIDVYESAASSVYHGGTISIRRRMVNGLDFRMAYTFAHAEDDGQDALVAGRPATVQNSYAPNSEKGLSTTDQRHRLVLAWMAEPRPFDRGKPLLSALFNEWRLSGVVTLGSGRPYDARVLGDANQDGNDSDDRLPGLGRNSLIGPSYATTDMRLGRRFHAGDRVKLDLMIESFNLFNHANLQVQTTTDGFQNSLGQFVFVDNRIQFNYFPASYRLTGNPFRATSAYAPRQIQLAGKLTF